eukprot:TRINITY_DN10572_c0_g1_i2.p1 TRINITY_DN10572_c0_g1~~TRINITY_DN10572_c0_g1_i2.p1  ORF type:complete len:120 (-),score=29.66 TRINITY_DN10572_c0_g1_i2:573-932(-)
MASWRDVVVQSTVDTAAEEIREEGAEEGGLPGKRRKLEPAKGVGDLRALKVSIDSEMLQKSQNSMGLMAMAADLQQHRRLPGVSRNVSDVLDEKAKSIGKLATVVMKSDTTRMLLNSLR